MKVFKIVHLSVKNKYIATYGKTDEGIIRLAKSELRKYEKLGHYAGKTEIEQALTFFRGHPLYKVTEIKDTGKNKLEV